MDRARPAAAGDVLDGRVLVDGIVSVGCGDRVLGTLKRGLTRS